MTDKVSGAFREDPGRSVRERRERPEPVDGELTRPHGPAMSGLRPGSHRAGVSLAQAINSLADELRRVSAEVQRDRPSFQIDPVELTLHVTASSAHGAGVEWRVLEEDDEQHTGVAHVLKLRLGWNSPGRDPKTDAVGENSAGPESRRGSDRAQEHRAEAAPAPIRAGRSGNPSIVDRAPETAPARLVRLTVYPLWGGDAESSESRLNARVLVKREVFTARSTAQLDHIELLRSQYANSNTSDRGEALRAATADYFAGQVEDKLDISWWETRDNFPLSSAADDLDKSAELLRSLAERPLAMAAHAAGADGPAVSILIGITAEAATRRLTAPLEDAARLCEVVGVLVGLATGMHPLVVACANRLVHDQLGSALAGAFERLIDPGPVSRDRAAGEWHGVHAAGRTDEQAAKAPAADRSAIGWIERATTLHDALTRNSLTARGPAVDRTDAIEPPNSLTARRPAVDRTDAIEPPNSLTARRPAVDRTDATDPFDAF